jgi:hypothetical protein
MTTATLTKTEKAKAATAAANAELYATLAPLLKTNAENVRKRVLRLKLGPTCGRCGGSGNYSYNQMHGTTCFGCAGIGNVLPRNKAERVATFQAAHECADSGRLEAYLEVNRAQRRSKDGAARVMAAWKTLDELNKYNWRTEPNDSPKVAINKIAYEAYTAVEKANKGAKTDWVAYDALVTEGIATIEALTVQLQAQIVWA